MTNLKTSKTRLTRGALTRESIARAALQLLDERSLSGFTLPALGRAMGADQTAVYRHFTSKDELVLAVADLLLHEVADGYVKSSCWRDNLAELSRGIREVYKRHPAAGSLSGSRTTGRSGEKRLVEHFLTAISEAGFTGAEIALYYRVVADFSLFWAGGHAGYLSLSPERQLSDESAWSRDYWDANPHNYPHTANARHELAEVGFEEIFETALTLMLDGVEARALNPCLCHNTRRLSGRNA